ncbi:MAG: hypothetical protein K0R08_394 [Solimicrobium sp.]|jgi:hypothetical protein|nr:hypothetical protein [Solimicrobium sp.]
MNFISPTFAHTSSSHPITSPAVASLQNICDSEFFKLDSDFEPLNPHFFNALAQVSEGSKEQDLIYLLLLKKPAIEIASLPFFDGACEKYTNLIVRALEDVLLHGKTEEKKRACYALLKATQNDTLPESIRQIAKIFLLQLMGKMAPIDIAAMRFPTKTFDEYTDAVVSALQAVLEKGKQGVITAQEMQKVRCSLLRACQTSEPSESAAKLIKAILIKFLAVAQGREIILSPTERLEDACNLDQIIISHLEKDLIAKFTIQFFDQIRINKNKTGSFYGISKSTLESNLEELRVIYSYLKNNNKQMDNHLIDCAIDLFLKEQDQFFDDDFEKPDFIFQILIDLFNDPTVETEAQFLLKVTSCGYPNSDFLNYLINTASNNRPTTAFWLGRIFREDYQYRARFQMNKGESIRPSDMKAIKYFYTAAIQGYIPAIEALQKFATDSLGEVKPKNSETLIMLSAIIDQGQIVGLNDKKLAIPLIEQVYLRDVNRQVGTYKICNLFRNNKLTIEDTFIEAKSLMNSTPLMGITILELISELNHHPLAVEARGLVDIWLLKQENQIQLIDFHRQNVENYSSSNKLANGDSLAIKDDVDLLVDNYRNRINYLQKTKNHGYHYSLDVIEKLEAML